MTRRPNTIFSSSPHNTIRTNHNILKVTLSPETVAAATDYENDNVLAPFLPRERLTFYEIVDGCLQNSRAESGLDCLREFCVFGWARAD